jgi:Legume lectin domain
MALGTMPATLADGEPHHVMVTYQPYPSGSWFAVYLDSTTQPALQAPVNISTTLGLTDNTAWVGLTAANNPANTGSVQILSWSFEPQYAARPGVASDSHGLLCSTGRGQP